MVFYGSNQRENILLLEIEIEDIYWLHVLFEREVVALKID
jgi:hypothetical protein